MSKQLAYKYLNGNNKSAKKQGCGTTNRDIFVASVINQKSVNQSAQQALVLIAAQVLNLIEAQFGFATNSDDDEICD
ncbi:hypothetical protein CLPU_10c01150 [Gottschalkia purinilytica]|uniref:Uncharacterized protein n=1 Tax=Gottschalkia purinilytica TaxID=1503 RepID=A0A0L0W9T2_GOTPU|nr:hypothetical protein [Gottschalkia purinilytica]KNF08060.1 hypothetical protein CLPU_10c01150 [Gottschalkia purinilytica]